MTERSALTELASFVGRSPLSSPDDATRRRAMDALARRLAPQAQRRSVGDLLSAVLALSARTRRMVMPQVGVELDVFSPDGRRAVDITLGQNA